jgi:5-dehydro-2-deoxygluconokinase
VLWGLARPADGAERATPSAEAARRIGALLPLCDLVVGTEEEFTVAGGASEVMSALRNVRAATAALLVLKLGPRGCTVFAGAIPDSLEDGVHMPGFPVEVFNVLGAGDGFAAGFLSGWLRKLPLEECARRANACGALVVSRHGCAPAMPSQEELELFLSRRDWPHRLRESAELNHVHRATTGRKPWPEVMALAFDHRTQLEELGPPERIRRFKRLVAEGLVRSRVPGAGAIVDDKHGEDALFALAGCGLWVARPVEVPGSRPLDFEAGANIGVRLRAWPAQHVVKCLVHYERQDLPKLRQLYEACVDTGHELLLELVSKNPPLAEIYAAGVKPDWWKLLPPADEDSWDRISATIARNDPHCRGVLLLGMEASEEELERGFALAARHPVCKGFAVGRSIFMDAARQWFAGKSDDEAVVRTVAGNYSKLVNLWKKARQACKESVS